jgi:hypothetical protein
VLTNEYGEISSWQLNGDVIIVEMTLLAAIIYFSVYLEHWAYTRSQKQEEKKTRKNIMMFIKNDL